MLIGIYTNILKDGDLAVTKLLAQQLKECAVDFYVYQDLAQYFKDVPAFSEQSSVPFDFIITVGGDGTILRIAKWCAIHKIPILGINLGKVGFLTEVERCDLSVAIKMLQSGSYRLEKRTILSTKIDNKNYFALNDVVINRNSSGKMIMLDVFVGKEKVDGYYSDGFIVSTPTGSTAYSLSAGGSIISPNARTLALTPINSHSLHSRPVVIDDVDTVRLVLKMGSAYAEVLIDGVGCGQLLPGQPLTVKKAAIKAQFVRFGENHFFNRLLSKLNSWSITPEGNH